MLKLTLSLALFFGTVLSITAQNSENCTDRELFSPLPNHKVTQCEFREFDKYEFAQLDESGSRKYFTKEGSKSTVSYTWEGDWEQRPSTLLIYKNYQNAVEKIGGKLLYSGSADYFLFEKAGNKFWMEISSDGSGLYRVTTIQEAEMTQYINFTANEIGKMMKFDGQVTFYGILFDSNKSTVKAESAKLIQEIATYLKANPKIKIYLVGHTDNTGTAEHNLTLSKARAAAVVTELTTNHGIPVSQVTAEGVGLLSPIATNDSENGKAKNRRVVMVLRN
jgi:outer membrane protein OmpA-like peptidoglycan-associated protein